MGSVGAQQRRTGAATPAITGSVLTDADADALRQTMGQTGYEAGDPNVPGKQKLYVFTSKAFNINAYLNSDGKDISSPNSSWDQLGYTKRMIANDVAKIDSGMRPLTQNVQLTRFVDDSALNKMFGLNLNSSNLGAFINRLQSDSNAAQNFSTLLKGTDYTHKAYTSTTYIQNHPAFGSRPIRFNVIAQTGTPAIITRNDREKEVLLGRGIKYKFPGTFRVTKVTDRFGRTRDQLVIDVII